MANTKGFDFNKAVDQVKGDKNLMIMTAGAAAVIVGLFLPWYSISFLGINTSISPGLNSTGFILAVFSLVAVAAGLNVLNKNKKNMAVLAIVMGVLAALVMFNNWPGEELGGLVETGIGYWFGLAGAVAVVAGSVMNFMKQK